MKPFKIFFSISFVLLVFSTKAIAQENNSLLWKISGEHLAHPSYLFGTIHAICPEYYLWTNKMQTALSQTNQLCLELQLNDPSLQENLLNLLKIKGDSTLEDFFSKKDYKKLTTFFKDTLHFPIAAFVKTKPFLLLSYLTIRSTDCEPVISYEKNLISMDSAQGVFKVIGLETPAEQLAYFEGLGKDYIQKSVLESVNNFAKNKIEFEKMEENYSKQKLTTVYNYIKESPNGTIFEKELLENRNKNWIPKLKGIIRQSPTFIAVGAGHLLGTNGVINLLRKEGFKVEPVL